MVVDNERKSSRFFFDNDSAVKNRRGKEKSPVRLEPPARHAEA